VTVVWSPLAVDRAVEAARRIAVDNPEAAQRWAEDLLEKVERLGRFPESGRAVSEVSRANVREIIHAGYRVIYRVQRTRVLILTVGHSRRLFDPGEVT